MLTDTTPASSPAAVGELAMAIVLEDLRRRVQASELTEADARQMIASALERFPPEQHAELHALVDARR